MGGGGFGCIGGSLGMNPTMLAQAQQMMGGGFGGMGGGFGGGGFGGGGMGGGGFGDKTTTTTPGRTSVCVPGLLCSSSVGCGYATRRGLRPNG